MQSAYISDILMQPECLTRVQMTEVAQAVEPVSAAMNDYQRVVLTGMGASLAALRPLWLALISKGHSAWLAEASECLGPLNPLINSSTLVIAASQSGRSAELIAVSEAVRARGGTLLALTNDRDSPLAQNAQSVVEIQAGPEMAVSTKTYINTLGVCITLGRVFRGLALDDALERTADCMASYLATASERVAHLKNEIGVPERMYFLARGSSMASAEYGALITKEAARCPVEAQSAAQFRHGPLELADARLTAIVLAGQDPVAKERNRSLYLDLRRYGAKSFWLDVGSEDPVVEIPHTPADTSPIVEVMPLQLLSVALAELTGIEPGAFRHLGKVTTVL